MNQKEQITAINDLLKSRYGCLLYDEGLAPTGACDYSALALYIIALDKRYLISSRFNVYEQPNCIWPNEYNDTFYDITSDTFNFQFEKILKFITKLNAIFSNNSNRNCTYEIKWIDHDHDYASIFMLISIEATNGETTKTKAHVQMSSNDFDDFIQYTDKMVNSLDPCTQLYFLHHIYKKYSMKYSTVSANDIQR